MTGVTAAAVGGFLKAKSGNPAYAEAFDPSVIGATLEVTAVQHLFQLTQFKHLRFAQAFETFLYRLILENAYCFDFKLVIHNTSPQCVCRRHRGRSEGGGR